MYDKIYREYENAFGGGMLDSFVLEVAEQIPSNGLVLEYGAGQGRTALILAERWLSVRVIELSHVGVASMNEAAKDKGLKNFTAEVGSANQPLKGEYDLVSSMLMLHSLTREEASLFIEKIKKET
jgi:cyclopropane fatty-acyl-phospholipid synthase-like methyltransferase